MDKAAYIAALRQEAAVFAAITREVAGQLPPSLPSCPGWNLTDLTIHLSSAQRLATKLVKERLQTPLTQPDQFAEILQLPPLQLMWAKNGAPASEPLPDWLPKWFEQGVTELVAALEEAETSETVWTWDRQNQTVSHWLHVMPIETAIHRWDAQNALKRAEAIEPELAVAGIDFVLETFVPHRRKQVNAVAGKGESYHLHRTDGPSEWLVRFDAEGVVVSHIHAKGDVALRGSASNLLLFLYHRVDASELEVFGDQTILDHYFELAPPG